MITAPTLLRPLYPGVTWNYPDTGKKVYLTFDDGPHPEITPALLSILDKYKVKASFFCVGENSAQYPELISAYREKGHQIGHHTYHHLNGLHFSVEEYVDNALRGNNIQSKFFRPPYGKLKPRQLVELKKHFKVVMWDVLSKDYKKGLTKEQCLKNVLKNIKPGSIVVFHENEKSREVMLETVPMLISHLQEKDWSFGLVH